MNSADLIRLLQDHPHARLLSGELGYVDSMLVPEDRKLGEYDGWASITVRLVLPHNKEIKLTAEQLPAA